MKNKVNSEAVVMINDVLRSEMATIVDDKYVKISLKCPCCQELLNFVIGLDCLHYMKDDIDMIDYKFGYYNTHLFCSKCEEGLSVDIKFKLNKKGETK